MKSINPYLSADELQITAREREGLIALARTLPLMKHTPRPFKTRLTRRTKPRTFDMSHVHSGGAACALGWLVWHGYVPDDQSYSDALFALFFPPQESYAAITPLRCSLAIYKFLTTGQSLGAYDE